MDVSIYATLHPSFHMPSRLFCVSDIVFNPRCQQHTWKKTPASGVCGDLIWLPFGPSHSHATRIPPFNPSKSHFLLDLLSDTECLVWFCADSDIVTDPRNNSFQKAPHLVCFTDLYGWLWIWSEEQIDLLPDSLEKILWRMFLTVFFLAVKVCGVQQHLVLDPIDSLNGQKKKKLSACVLEQKHTGLKWHECK